MSVAHHVPSTTLEWKSIGTDVASKAAKLRQSLAKSASTASADAKGFSIADLFAPAAIGALAIYAVTMVVSIITL